MKRQTIATSLNAGLLTGVGSRIASPLGLLIGVPALVLAAGLLVGWNGQRALAATVEEAVSERFRDRCDGLRRWLDQELGNLPPLLLRLGHVMPLTRPSDEAGFAHLLADHLSRHPALAYISWSMATGEYRGVERLADGALRYQTSGVEDGGWVTQHRLAEGSLILESEHSSNAYDPRRRPFWQEAIDGRGPVWTAPYRFAGRGQPGMTCALALRDSQGAVVGVLTADVDLLSLSHWAGRLATPDERSLVVSAEGAILAYPNVFDLPDTTGDDLPTPAHLSDPLLAGLDRAVLQRDEDRIETVFTGARGEVRVRAERWPLPGSDRHLWLAHLAAVDSLRAPLTAHLAQSRLVGLVLLAAAVLVSALFARHAGRQRRALASARARAESAERQADELGSYRLVRRLGQGGMGEVWLAEHRLLARPAALKLIRRSTLVSADDVEQAEINARFQREARITAGLRCQHTIALHDFGTVADGTFYYVMELLQGLDLDLLVRQHGTQPAARVLRIMRQACASLAEAHDRGLVHRDIKPGNIFLCRIADELDWVKVLDFGIAHVRRNAGPGITQASVVVGTPGYMSPEHARGQPLDGRADLYSLACVGWLLLCGRPVYSEAGEAMAVLLRHINEPLPDLKAICPSPLPAAVVELFAACLAKSPEERPADARALGERINEALPLCAHWGAEEAAAWWVEHGPRDSLEAPASSASQTILRIG